MVQWENTFLWGLRLQTSCASKCSATRHRAVSQRGAVVAVSIRLSSDPRFTIDFTDTWTKGSLAERTDEAGQAQGDAGTHPHGSNGACEGNQRSQCRCRDCTNFEIVKWLVAGCYCSDESVRGTCMRIAGATHWSWVMWRGPERNCREDSENT